MTTAKQPLKIQIPEAPAGDFIETEARLVGRMPDDAGTFPMNDMTDERSGYNACPLSSAGQIARGFLTEFL